jgi:hypothetical protein
MNADQAVAVALKQRYATLFAAVDQSIADEIAGAANSTEAVGQVISKVTEKAAIRRQIEDQIKAVQAWIDGVLDQAIVAPENKHLAWRLMDANQLVRNMTAALDGSLQSIANLAAALQSRAALAIEYLAAIQGVTGDIEAVIGRTASAAPDQSLSAQLATSADKVREYAAGLNTSVESHQALLAVITERYALEVQYLTTIKALSAEISATLAATAETIRTAFFTPQESYDYLKDRANAASASLATATTPEQVQAIIATINQATQSAWQTLGADTVEQRAKQQEFLTFLTEVDALAQERLAVVEQAAQQESADLRGTVSDAMDRMATSVDNLVRATGALNAATNKLNEIMPTALTVNVAAAGYA